MTLRWSAVLGAQGLGVGDLSFDGPTLVQGQHRGDLRSSDLIEIAVGAVVVGKVSAPQVLLGGRVEGTVEASERATLLESAQLIGGLRTPWLDLRLGARVDGWLQVERGDP